MLLVNTQILAFYLNISVDPPPSAPVWLKHLMSVCLLKPEVPDNHHTMFCSLEALLTLLEWQLVPHPLPASNHPVDNGSVEFSFLSKAAQDHVLLNVHFEKVVLHCSK